MKRQFTLLLFLLSAIFGQTLSARTVEFEEAKKLAISQYHTLYNCFRGSLDLQEISILSEHTYSINADPLYYAFSFSPEGFLIIAADDSVFPVIGYSFTGAFPDKLSISNSFGRFMESRAEMILFAKRNHSYPNYKTLRAWADLRNNDTLYNYTKSDKSVPPLLVSLWDQNYPYNIKCPEDPDGPGDHVYAGCIATSMAQIMHYWRYPSVGEGQHSYVAGGYGMQTVFFGTTYYNWEGMQNSIDHGYPFPLAKLLYHAGVSIEMDYGPNVSLSYTARVDDALRDFFRYNNAEYVSRHSYSNGVWKLMLKSNLDIGRPILYSGESSSGGHAFVCDGYQDNYFHFNFGWSGIGNGYYTLEDINGYNNNQDAIIHIFPTDEDYPYYASGFKAITNKSGSITDGSGPIKNYLNNTQASWLIDPQAFNDSVKRIKIEFHAFDILEGDTLSIYNGETSDAPLLGHYSGNEIPDELSSSGNKVFITFTTDSAGTASGWYMEYKAKAPFYCDGMTTLNDVHGVFNDGSGELNYNNATYCRWVIEPEYAGKISLSFNSFKTESGKDYLLVYDEDELIGNFSGHSIPEMLVAHSGRLLLKFVTNSNTTDEGWEAEYQVDNVSLPEQESAHEFYIYPNPSDAEINIKEPNTNTSNSLLEVYSMTGNLVHFEKYSLRGSRKIQSSDLGHLKPGIYVLKIKHDDKLSIHRIVLY